MENMTNINQLILDCAAKVLRINQTTPAEIDFTILGFNNITCDGFTHGWNNASKSDTNEGRKVDYKPLSSLDCGWINLKYDGAEENLKKLLESLNDLEKELLSEEKQNA
jgi:hypothetical protein